MGMSAASAQAAAKPQAAPAEVRETETGPVTTKEHAAPPASEAKPQTAKETKIAKRAAGAQKKPRFTGKTKAEAKSAKAAAKPTKGKVPAKSKAKAPAKKAKSSGGSGKPRMIFSKDDVIMMDTKKNPRKEGTTKHKQFALLVEHHGKTVGEFDKKKGQRGALRSAIKHGWAHVKSAKKTAA